VGETKHDIIIVGAGSAGITVAAQLKKADKNLDIAIIDPAEVHYYQPLFTLVGAGVSTLSETRRRQESLIPSGVTWYRKSVMSFSPNENRLSCDDKSIFAYNFLIVCPGIQMDWAKITGLTEALGKNGVCSNYSAETVEKTWETIQAFKNGRAIFTFPNTLIKCAGAPQKIMYLAEHYFRKQGVRDNAEIMFVSAGKAIFGVKKYADALSRIIEKRGIKTLFGYNLESIDGPGQTVTFRNVETQEEKKFDFKMIHVTPPMSAPGFVRASALANEAGWVDVDQYKLVHKKYENIFALGDASSLPTSKTGAAIRMQAPVVVGRLLAKRNGKQSDLSYNGYTSCPLVTGYGKLILAEFDYSGQPTETFPFDQSKERLSMYLLKKHGLPLLYWQGMLKGRA
jgi:sulfide:quinone oxidoreductase